MNGVFITKGLDAAKNVCGRNNKNEEKVLGLRRTYITPPIIMIINLMADEKNTYLDCLHSKETVKVEVRRYM